MKPGWARRIGLTDIMMAPCLVVLAIAYHLVDDSGGGAIAWLYSFPVALVGYLVPGFLLLRWPRVGWPMQVVPAAMTCYVVAAVLHVLGALTAHQMTGGGREVPVPSPHAPVPARAAEARSSPVAKEAMPVSKDPRHCSTSPRGDWSLCIQSNGCEHYCHYEVFLVRDGSRTRLGEAEDTVIVAWSPKGTALAVEADGLTIVSLDTGERWNHADLALPSFSANGALYARSTEGDYFEVRFAEKRPLFRLSAASKKRLASDLASAAENGGTGELLEPTAFDSQGKPIFAQYRAGQGAVRQQGSRVGYETLPLDPP